MVEAIFDSKEYACGRRKAQLADVNGKIDLRERGIRGSNGDGLSLRLQTVTSGSKWLLESLKSFSAYVPRARPVHPSIF